jgi:uncharacterized protein (UPF0297 family)
MCTRYMVLTHEVHYVDTFAEVVEIVSAHLDVHNEQAGCATLGVHINRYEVLMGDEAYVPATKNKRVVRKLKRLVLFRRIQRRLLRK